MCNYFLFQRGNSGCWTILVWTYVSAICKPELEFYQIFFCHWWINILTKNPPQPIIILSSHHLKLKKKRKKKRAFSWDRKKGSLPEKTEHSHELDQIPLIFTKDLLKIDRRQKKTMKQTVFSIKNKVMLESEMIRIG